MSASDSIFAAHVPPHESLLRTFLSYYRPHVGLFVADTVAALVLSACDLAFPQILRTLTGGLFAGNHSTILAVLPWVTGGLVVLYAIRYFCSWFVTSWGHIMGSRMESSMRQDLFDAYERMSFGYFDRHHTGDLMSRVTNDLFDIAEAAHHGPEWIVICSIEIVGVLHPSGAHQLGALARARRGHGASLCLRPLGQCTPG